MAEFNILIVAQNGRLMYEAIIFLASLRRSDPSFPGRVFVAIPQPGDRWQDDPSVRDQGVLDLFDEFGATVLPFESHHFGQDYPYGNKAEALLALPEGEPFVFFDTDTLITDKLSTVPFEFDRPSASMRREGTWPKIELYGPGYDATWRSLYEMFDVPFDTSLDPSFPDEYWERHLYFNAGWFFYRCPQVFGRRLVYTMVAIRDTPPETLVCQSLDPWLDQIALPIVIHGLGGGRPGPELAGLDGETTCHWRALPLLYARQSDAAVACLEEVTAPNRVKKVLKQYDPFKRMIYQGRGARARDLFDRNALPKKEAAIRNRLKRERLWVR